MPNTRYTGKEMENRSPHNYTESVNKKDKKWREKYCMCLRKRETDREGR